MRIFKDSNELIQAAIGLTADRLSALEKDVDHCLSLPLAPLPAIAYCFSTVDLMGALYNGDARKYAPTTNQSFSYMVDFMHYTKDQAEILQRIFRHKIVHLAMPKAVINYNSMNIGWKYYHENKAEHLRLEKFLTTQILKVPPSSLEISYDYEFRLGIKDFQIDIANSVVNPKGYLDALKGDSALQQKFEKALIEMYDPNQ